MSAPLNEPDNSQSPSPSQADAAAAERTSEHGASRSNRRRRRRPRHRFAPSQWPTWLGIGLAWLIARLPLSTQRRLGLHLGTLAYHLARSRRRIAARNLELCFPELSAAEQAALGRDSIRQITLGTIELANAWLNPRRNVRPYCTVSGLEHLKAAQAEGRGVVMIGGHFAVMDIISQTLSDIGGIDLMYRRNKQPAWEWLQMYGRSHYFDNIHEREETRAILRALKRGRTVWYAADQDYGPRHSVFAPFYGVPAATITATMRFARLNSSPVLMLSQHRDRDRLGWHLHFTAPLEQFPSGNDLADAARLNALLEQEIDKDRAQYLWVHKRFKTRPAGEPSLYR